MSHQRITIEQDDITRQHIDTIVHGVLNRATNQVVAGTVDTPDAATLQGRVLNRGIMGTFHHVSPKHLDRYVPEFAGRHNVRQENTQAQIRALVSGMSGKRLRYADLIG